MSVPAARLGEAAVSDFLSRVPEKADVNQYWYSPATVAAIRREILAQAPARVAFLATPSLFFAFSAAERAEYALLDIDADFRSEPRWTSYDFREPAALPASLHGAFDMVVIDPPFITEEVWALFAQAARLLLPPAGGGMVIATTVLENEALLARLLGTTRVRFQPSIPHLVYQYSAFCAGFVPTALGEANPEIPED